MRAESRATAAADRCRKLLHPPRGGRKGTPAAILIIDSDLNFAFWLGQALDSSGYVSLPARDTHSAAELAALHGLTVEIIVIDPLQRGAASFIDRLRRSFQGLKAVAAQGPEAEFLPASDLYDAVIRKPAHRTAEAADEWVRLIRALSPPEREDHSVGR